MSKRKGKSNFDLNKFTVLYDNVLIKGLEVEERDGVYKPAQYDDKPDMGEVLKAGPGRLLDNRDLVPLSVKIGDIVYFNKYSSTKFNYDGVDYYLLREEDIYGYIR